MSSDKLRAFHREEYVFLAGLTHHSALVAWGAFYFKVKGDPDTGEWKLIDEDDLGDLKGFDVSRRNLIGAHSAPYAAEGTAAEVTITEKATGESRTELFAGSNHALFKKLKPDTVYTYSVKINGREWGAGPLRDWVAEGDKGFMRPSEFEYENEFRTLPDPARPSPDLTFAVLGDFGRGVRVNNPKSGRCQREVAEALMRAVREHDVRLILTTGDNIYHGSKQGSGDEDDDWFFTYFQPYRFVINRVLVVPTVGNHDEGETESCDDRKQLDDNFFIKNRFVDPGDTENVSHANGLFYRFRYGSDVEFVSLDTSKKSPFSREYFKEDVNREFLDRILPADGGAGIRWRIPFFHHPPYSAGPNHGNDKDVIKHLVPRFERAGVRAAFCGHQHNFQHALHNGVNYFVTGASGKFEAKAPRSEDFEEAHTQAWGGNEEGHFVLAEIKGERMTVTPFGHLASGALRPLKIHVVRGNQDVPPFVVEV